jgi:S-adenosyl-L-methionine hydrolase (adenosine-forming)
MAPARAIALLTDFGRDEFYAGVMRAVVAAASPASRVIDLSHDVPAHDVAAASFVLSLSIDYLPRDAVVVAVIDPGVGGARRAIVVEVGERVVVAPDNGILSDLLVAGSTGKAWAVDEARATRAAGVRARGATFHGRDVFGPVAAAIARGAQPGELGAEAEGIVLLRDVPSVSVDGGHVRGTGRYVDHFGNVLSDIPRAVLDRVFGGEAARVAVRVGGRDLGPLRNTYVDGHPGELIALLNSWDRVEAAVNGARAIDVLGEHDAAGVQFDLCTP